jgi:hypothetical protein
MQATLQHFSWKPVEEWWDLPQEAICTRVEAVRIREQRNRGGCCVAAVEGKKREFGVMLESEPIPNIVAASTHDNSLPTSTLDLLPIIVYNGLHSKGFAIYYALLPPDCDSGYSWLMVKLDVRVVAHHDQPKLLNLAWRYKVSQPDVDYRLVFALKKIFFLLTLSWIGAVYIRIAEA